MKTKLNVVFSLLLVAVQWGCVDEHIPSDSAGEVKESRVKVGFNVLLPLTDLPSTRAIGDDSGIHDFTVWVFNKTGFVKWERMEKREDNNFVHGEGDNDLAVVYDGSNGGTMEMTLPKEWTGVRLMMVANDTVTAPDTCTSWTDAEKFLQEQTFIYDGPESKDYMPMYGTSGETPMEVKQGMEGKILLRRCMAKIVVDAAEARDHFQLKGIYVCRVNVQGTVAPKNPIANMTDSLTEQIEGVVDGELNAGTVYIPEITGIKDTGKMDGTTTTFVIIEGSYTPKEGESPVEKYYRLDFITHIKDADGKVSYMALESLERNHCYFFEVDYLIKGVGKDNKEEARLNPAANIIQKEIEVITITDDDIMDITTDNYTYLGVTSSRLEAKLTTSKEHYFVDIHVVTNAPGGWKMDALPGGIIAVPNEFVPPAGAPVSVHSIWVFLPTTIYNNNAGGKTEETVYIYSANIRKSIVITIPNK